MHFVNGGAYNGKANWVKQYYELDKNGAPSYRWICADKNERLIESIEEITEEIIILEGLEYWTLRKCETKELDTVRYEFRKMLEHFQEWSLKESRQFVLIGTDISKGVVPADPLQRKWRDATGFIYQDIVKMSSTFHYVWYGIAKQLK